MNRLAIGSAIGGAAQSNWSFPGINRGLALLMDELAYGVLIAQPDAGILHLNSAAQHELARSELVHARGGRLQACRADHGVRLRAAIARAGRGIRSVVTLDGAAGEALLLAIVPFQDADETGAAQVAVLFPRPLVCESLMLCFFARSHGLTRTEEQVLGILCQGRSAPEIAKQMHVAVSTVRSHVRSLCAKTYSKGVRHLISRIATLPPVVPALRSEAQSFH